MGEKVSVMSQPCFSGCPTTSCLPPKGSSLLSWECLFSWRARCLPGFLCAHGAFDKTQKQVLETKLKKIVLKELLLSCPVISSSLELSLCTQAGWVPQGSSEVPSMPWAALPGQSSRLASAPGLCRATHWLWVLRSVSWEVQLRLWNSSNWGSRRSIHPSDTVKMWLATLLPWCVDAVVRFSWEIVAWGLWQNRSCSSGSVLMVFVKWTQLYCVGGWSSKAFYRSPRYKTCVHCLFTSTAKPAGWCCQKRAQLAPSALCACSPKW